MRSQTAQQRTGVDQPSAGAADHLPVAGVPGHQPARLLRVLNRVASNPWTKAIVAVLVLLLAVTMPVLTPDNASLFKFTTMAMWMGMGIAWNWVAGFAGRIDLAFGAYFATGAYVAAYLMTKQEWPFLPAIIVGAIGAALFAFVIGVAFLRLKGMSYSIATLCVYLAIEQLPPLLDVVGAGAGLNVPVFLEQNVLWYLFAGVVVLGLAATVVIRRSQFGLALLAARDDELSADSRGVNISFSHVAIYTAMGLTVGLVGGLWALQNGFVSPPTVFTSSLLLFVLLLVLVGGIGTVPGPFIGAIVFTEVGDLLWNQFLELHDLILSVFLIVIALVAPHGLSKRTFADLAGRWRARRSVAPNDDEFGEEAGT